MLKFMKRVNMSEKLQIYGGNTMFKKILSALLAAVMVAGVSVTAFAENVATEEDLLIDDGDFILAVIPAEELPPSLGGNTPFAIWQKVNEDGSFETGGYDFPQTVGMNNIKPGDKIALKINKFELPENFDFSDVSAEFLKGFLFYFQYSHNSNPTKEDVRGWKVDADWQFEETEDLIEDIKIEAIYGISLFEFFSGSEVSESLSYYITIEFKDDVEEIDYNDLVGKLTLYKRNKSNANETLQVLQMNANYFATVGYDSIDYDKAGFEEITGEGNGAPVRDFDAADMNETAELYFEGVGYFFSGDVSTEAPKYLAFNYTPDYELLAKYPTADMEFINFPGMVKFNQFGSFELFKEPDQFAYAVVDGELVTLESIARFGKVVDGEDEGYSVVLQLKNFPESFVLSDTELELAEAVEETEEAIDAEPAA